MSSRGALAGLLLAACSDYALEPKPDHHGGVVEACELLADTGRVATDADCVVEPVIGSFDPQVEWQWNTNPVHPGYDDIMSTPAAANLTDDDGDGHVDEHDIPDVVFTTFAGGAYTSAGALVAVSGDGSGTLWSVTEAGGYHLYSSGSPAIGDLDADGLPEVCTAGYEVAVLCVTNTGLFKMAGGSEPSYVGSPALGDLDADGIAEVVIGRTVVNADGSTRWTGGGGAGYFMSFPVDLDVDGQVEVVAGNTLYAADGTILWTDGTPDGMSAVGDFDLDGIAEVVHTGGGAVYLTGADGVVRWSTAMPGGGGGPPTVADFDNDGLPEVGVAGAYYYAVFDTDGAVLWYDAVQDYSSSVTGSSVFDFEGDGAADVVYGDELTLWVYDGATGAVKLQLTDHASGTLYEYPLILDVDNDGATEIVLASNNYTFTGWNGITVIGDASGTWRPSRPVWNQFAYSITSVGDDGSIPAVAEPNWYRFNNFRTGGALTGLTSQLADLAPGPPDTCVVECEADVVELTIPISNFGTAATGEFVVSVVSSADGSTVASASLRLAAGAQADVGPLRIARASWRGSLEVRVDEAGAVEECDESDNTRSLGEWPCDG